jgi:hypothetical protein
MRWALAVTPANYPLLICHVSNEIVQVIQLGRWATAPAYVTERDRMNRNLTLRTVV